MAQGKPQHYVGHNPAGGSVEKHMGMGSGEVNEDAEGFWEGIHEFFANFTLLLVALHILGVIASSIIDKENLIKAMLTGRKDLD